MQYKKLGSIYAKLELTDVPPLKMPPTTAKNIDARSKTIKVKVLFNLIPS